MRGILVDSQTGELIVDNKTLKIGDNRLQVAQHIIIAFQGEYKHAPLLGGNAKKMICGKSNPFWLGFVQSQLQSEGLSVRKIEFEENNTINIALEY